MNGDPLKTHAQNIKAVTFDLWETLLFEKDGASVKRTTARCRNLGQTLNRFGVQVSVAQVKNALDKTISSLLEKWDKNEDVTHENQIQLIFKNLKRESTILKREWISALSAAYVSPIFEVPPYLNPDARTTLKWLRNRNTLISLICNTGLTPGTALRRFLSEQEISDYFDSMIFSDELGVRKPDCRIFNLAAEKMKVKACEVVHIGDNLKADVWGAKNAGFNAIHLSSDAGRDKIAEADPTSLVSISRNLGNLKREHLKPDKTVTSLAMAREAIREIETM